MIKFKIAGLVVELECDRDYIAPEYFSFECSAELKTDIYWNVVEDKTPDFPEKLSWKEMRGFSIARIEDQIYAKYLIPDYYLVDYIAYAENEKKVIFYIPNQEGFRNNESRINHLSASLFSFQREALFLALLHYGGISIHSSSILYKDRGIVFSALSGTGKTTHTNMWAERYQTPILDGDVTICRMIDGRPIIYGLPWCGSSEMFLNQEVELQAVVFLKQAPENNVEELALVEFIRNLFARSFTTMWYDDMCQLRSINTEKICSSGIKGYSLSCRPDYEAVELIKSKLDQ